MSLSEAYACCEEITGAEARNFSYGIRLLPPAKRQAMSAIYAMARRVDDIGDGDLPPGEKLARLATVRKHLAQQPPPQDDLVLVALHDAAERFPIPLPAFGELIEGCEMDAAATGYETFDELVGYCRRVAGSIGRLSLGVFGATDLEAAAPRADALGIALQVTNILRDLVEDRDELGRVYVPREDLHRFGIGPDLGGRPDDLAALVVFEARRAVPYWERGLGLLPMLDRRSRACVAAMAGIYHRLFTRIQRSPTDVLTTRVSLPSWEKAWVAARSLAGGGA
ncbi:MAG: phytoene/squalene synthase family protein [Acidimicrobiales bacterium]